MTTEKPTTESMNRVIAEFMGGKPDIINHARSRIRFEYPINGQYSFTKKELKYHADWNMLMPVWIKFRDIDISENNYIKYSDWLDTLAWYLYSSNEPARFSERLYYAILWYNSHK